ncbi:MAG: histidine phosphatase family protein [Lysobacterales bacterium]
MALVLCVPLAGAASGAVADEELWHKLATERDLIVFMRHMNSSGGNPLQWDPSGGCEGETPLTEKGRAQAKQLGALFLHRGITPGAVISSPMCRCRDTARLAFGGELIVHAALREISSADRERTAVFERAALTLLARHAGGSPVVFISHRPNIELLTVELIAEGELIVARMSRQGAFDVLGKLRIDP